MSGFGNPDELLDDYWRQLAYAARYGHQPVLAQLSYVTYERLAAFNRGVDHWIKEENKRPEGGLNNRYATGGG